MRILGLILLIGGILIKLFSPSVGMVSWIIVGFGVVVLALSFVTGKK
ncbi:MAG: hypothetical protein JSV96_11475 [Candidatus Aminicenantes bacterium]|nr:MAG: hypothetical protein JSV96_11475 [Candidatus Aminicenantes bacterium]